MMLALVVICVFHACCIVRGESTRVQSGVKIRLTEYGLKYIFEERMKTLKESLIKDDVRFQFGFTGGNQKYWIDTKMRHLGVQTYSLKIKPGYGIRFRIEGINARVTGKVHTTAPNGLSNLSSRPIEISTNGTTLTFAMKVNAKNGYPVAQLTTCSVHIGSVTIPYQNNVKQWLPTSMKLLLEKPICKKASELVQKNLTRILQTFTERKNLTKKIYIDFGFQTSYFTSYYADFYFRGEIVDRNNSVTRKLSLPQVEPLEFGPSKMVSIWISASSLNSFGETLHNSKLLNRRINPGLNTGYLGYFLPELSDAYPESSPIIIYMQTLKPPRFEIKPEKASVHVYIKTHLYVVNKDGSETPMFYLNITIDGIITPILQRKDSKIKIGGGITNFDTSISVGGSTIGTLDVAIATMETLIGGFVVDQVNPVFAKGYPIPQSDCFEFMNPSLSLDTHAIRIDTTLMYNVDTCKNY